MYIENQASKNKVKYISNKPPKDYYNTCNLDLLIGELCEIKGIDATIEYLQHKLKYYKSIKKGAKKEDE
jgi:hypothetical protein